MFTSPLFLIFIFFALLSWIVSSQLRSRLAKYSQVPLTSGLSGREVAERMLQSNGIYNVKVMSVAGELTDHYNPTNRTINLSNDVYHGRNVSAAAVAAHETGHAIQHYQSYAFLEFRSALVPLQNVSAKVLNIIFIAMFAGALLMPGLMPMKLALQIIIAAYAVFTLFAFVTLPVEIDASRRALAWLSSSGITSGASADQAKDALKWAAYTYVVAALSALATLIYYIMVYTSRRD
jgi:Zn-dependent membrane protease YugP